MTRQSPSAALLAVALLATACSDSNKGKVEAATFNEAARVSGPAQVFVALDDVVGQTVTVAVHVRDLAGVAASDLALEYDPVRLVYSGFLRGSFLEQGPAAVDYQVSEQFPGLLVVRVSRAAGSVDADGTDPVLVYLTFVVVSRGLTPATFSPASTMLDDAGQPLPGVTLFSGSFEGF